MNTGEDYLLDLGEHAYIGVNSASIVMEVFSCLCYVGKWERGDKEKLKKHKMCYSW